MDGGSLVASDALQSYLSAIAAVPILDAEQERQLARQWRSAGDARAAKQLVLSNLRFVVFIARGYAGYGLPLGDLVQEGNIGLMKAVKRFDPEKGVRLISFAVHWIRSEIHEFVIRNWRTVKIATTKAQRKLFFRLRGLKSHLGWLTPAETSAIAHELGVDPADVRSMEARLSEHDVAFGSAPSEHVRAPEDYLPAVDSPAAALEESQTDQQRHAHLQRALVTLDPRARDIVTRRWLEPDKTGLRELAHEYGVSAERIRQIQNQALAQMRTCMDRPRNSGASA